MNVISKNFTCNESIREKEIRVIDSEGNQLGVISTKEALQMAEEKDLDLGFDVRGYEISKSIACNARNNIEYLGYNREIITSGDMHDIKEKYDVAIVDIPYGLYSPITVQEQVDIINTSRRIARRLVIITFEDMDNIIISAGFRILDKCYMTKGNMKREISICE